MSADFTADFTGDLARDFLGRTGVAVVAGGSGGIGAAICRLLVERGSAVVFTYHRNEAAARALENELGARAVQLDARDTTAAGVFIDGVAAAEGAIHTLVYSLGPVVRQRHLSAVKPAELASSLEAEVVAFFNLAQPALTHLRASSGSIVAVTTAATRRVAVRDGLSAGPKAAVEALVRGIAAEEGRYGVRANCVGPGMLTDGMAAVLTAAGDLDDEALGAARRNIPLRRFGDAADVAEAVCFLASDRADYISGQHLAVDGGYTA